MYQGSALAVPFKVHKDWASAPAGTLVPRSLARLLPKHCAANDANEMTDNHAIAALRSKLMSETP